MKFPKPWYRKSRRAWFVTLDGQQIKLGTTKDAALSRYQDLMAKPPKRVVPSGSLLAIIDAFLDWCQKHRAPDTYEWYRCRLERLAQRHPNLRAVDLRPFHVQQWIDAMDVSSGTKRNYCRSIKRCMRWAKAARTMIGAAAAMTTARTNNTGAQRPILAASMGSKSSDRNSSTQPKPISAGASMRTNRF